MEFPWRFNDGVSMQFSSFFYVASMSRKLHGTSIKPALLIQQNHQRGNGKTFKTYLESPCNLHQTSMEPPWNLHRSYNRTFKTYLDMGVIYIKTPWNLHGTSIKPASLIQQDHQRGTGKTFKTFLKNPCNLHQTSTEPLEGKWQDLQNIPGKSM